MTSSKQIWETNPLTSLVIGSICPSRDGHRILVRCEDGSVRMWELDLENLAMNQADIMDTQADVDMPEFIAFLLSQSLGDLGITRGECLGRTRWSSPLDWTTYLYYFYKWLYTTSPQSHVLLECSTIT